ncbi:MAG: VanZ family protein [Pseudomonadota bacterium]
MTAAVIRWPRLWVGLGLFLCVNVFIASMVPLNALSAFNIWDKAEHAVVFAALSVWFSALVPRRRYVWLALALLAFGVSIEVGQMLTVDRSPEIADVVADIVGISVGLVLAAAGARHWARWVESLTAAVLLR